MNPYGGGFRTFTDPVSPELQQFASACGDAAERQAKKGSPETDGGCFRRAGEFSADIAVDHLAHPLGRVNVEQLGISQQMLMAIEPVVYVAPDGIENAAEQFCKRYGFLIRLIAEAIQNYETGPGAREVLL